MPSHPSPQPATNCTGGKVSRPAEMLLKGKRLAISSYDNPVKHFVHVKSDALHTDSVTAWT